MSGKMFRITSDSDWVADPPKHHKTNAYPLVNPKACPGAQLEFLISEMRPGGGADDDVHPDEDQLIYCLSGRATVTVDGEGFLLEPGCALWVPKGAVHSFDAVHGGETLRLAVVTAPPRGA